MLRISLKPFLIRVRMDQGGDAQGLERGRGRISALPLHSSTASPWQPLLVCLIMKTMMLIMTSQHSSIASCWLPPFCEFFLTKLFPAYDLEFYFVKNLIFWI